MERIFWESGGFYGILQETGGHFTGSNGRIRGGSAGIGLYLCRKLAVFLELELRMDSQEGAGTTVTLTFSAKENLTKL